MKITTRIGEFFQKAGSLMQRHRASETAKEGREKDRKRPSGEASKGHPPHDTMSPAPDKAQNTDTQP